MVALGIEPRTSVSAAGTSDHYTTEAVVFHCVGYVRVHLLGHPDNLYELQCKAVYTSNLK
jgi:hypothetical protein